MIIYAIDPGNVKSAIVGYETERKDIAIMGIWDNHIFPDALREMYHPEAELVIEMIASYGMPVGATIFETCVWIGRFSEAWESVANKESKRIYRKDVKMFLCNSMRAKDGNVRQAIIDRFPATGGGAIPQIGTKKQPGALYGISGDMWAALAVALTYAGRKG